VEKKSIGLAILAAALYGISAPVSKLLLVELSPTLMAALLYLGAGFGMLMVNVVKILFKRERLEARMTRRELPYVISMILLDIAAPIFLMLGLTLTTSSTASLLNNFEIVATSMIALFIFHEAVGKRMWVAIALITLSSVILSVDDFGSLSFSVGSLFVLLACICWGFENNCTRMLSLKDPLQIVVVKGFGSGLGALLITIYRNDMNGSLKYIGIALLLGFIAYGLSIYFYIKAQRTLGAARTSAYYAAAPFIGVIVSWIVLREGITNTFLVSLGIMLLGTYFAVSEDHAHKHVHEKTRHEHKHSHDDGHHGHTHANETIGEQGHEHGNESSNEHSHEHVHEGVEHVHKHMPDLHHRHSH
jgi:drug/metabolite transporter (DMT)-like permease